MSKVLKLALISFISVIGLQMFSATSAVTYAAPAPAATSSPTVNAACEGIALTGADCNSTTGPSVENTIPKIINILSTIVGVIAVIMIIVGGLKYITSGGEAASITSAKHTIMYAVVGLVVVALAQVIVIFVLNKVKG